MLDNPMWDEMTPFQRHAIARAIRSGQVRIPLTVEFHNTKEAKKLPVERWELLLSFGKRKIMAAVSDGTTYIRSDATNTLASDVRRVTMDEKHTMSFAQKWMVNGANEVEFVQRDFFSLPRKDALKALAALAAFSDEDLTAVLMLNDGSISDHEKRMRSWRLLLALIYLSQGVEWRLFWLSCQFNLPGFYAESWRTPFNPDSVPPWLSMGLKAFLLKDSGNLDVLVRWVRGSKKIGE